MNTDAQEFELIQSLFSLRNKLVHAKSVQYSSSKEENLSSPFKEIHKIPKDIKNSISAIKYSTKFLWQIDKSFQHLNDYKFLWDKKSKINIDPLKPFENLVNSMVAKEI